MPLPLGGYGLEEGSFGERKLRLETGSKGKTSTIELVRKPFSNLLLFPEDLRDGTILVASSSGDDGEDILFGE